MPPLRSGRHRLLEEQADLLIKQSLKGVTKHSEKSDILTPWKAQERRRREVYNRTGVADPAMRKGMYHREANRMRPELNSRDGVAPPRQTGGSLGAFVEEHGYPDDDG